MYDDVVGMREAAHFLFGREFLATETAEVVYECNYLGSAHVCAAAYEYVVFLQRVLQCQHIAAVQAERGNQHSGQCGEESENLVVEVGLRQGYVLESHALQHVLHIVLRFRARMYEIAVVMRQVAIHVTAVFRVFLMLFCKIKDNFLYTCPLMPVSCRAEHRTWECLQNGAEKRTFSGCDNEN